MDSNTLRERIRRLNEAYAAATGTPHYTSSSGVVLYPNGRNLYHESLKAIEKKDDWRDRLDNAHSHRASFPAPHADNACELDSSNSSDALLMSIFCHETTRRNHNISRLLGVGAGPFEVDFGWKAKVDLIDGTDRTEVDMVVEDKVLVEAKLTEADFQSMTSEKLKRYEMFEEMFDSRRLTDSAGAFLPAYQIVRNILAAYQHTTQLVFIYHADRMDLANLVLKTCTAIRYPNPPPISLVTWQEIASEVNHQGLSQFLQLKYGI